LIGSTSASTRAARLARSEPAKPDLAVSATNALGEAALQVGFTLMLIAAASDTLFAALDNAGARAWVEGVALSAIALAGLLTPTAAARLLRRRGAPLVMAALFALAGALDWGVQSHFAEVAPAIVWIAAIASSRRWVIACVAVSALGYIVDLLLTGRSLPWLVAPAGRNLVVNQTIDLIANAAAVLLVIALLRRFILGVPASLEGVRTGAPAVTPALTAAVRLQLPPPRPSSPLWALTKTELEVLEELAAGLAPGEIAFKRGLKITTIRTHIAAIKRKTAARTLPHAAAIHARWTREC
jgi:DNA-binding CsgD family transcriptional regulator